MKKFSVVGFSRYSGEYEGRPYAGYYVHCLSEDDPGPGFEGRRVKELKAKEKLGYVPHVGDLIQVEYGEYGIEEITAIAY